MLLRNAEHVATTSLPQQSQSEVGLQAPGVLFCRASSCLVFSFSLSCSFNTSSFPFVLFFSHLLLAANSCHASRVVHLIQQHLRLSCRAFPIHRSVSRQLLCVVYLFHVIYRIVHLSSVISCHHHPSMSTSLKSSRRTSISFISGGGMV